MTNLARAPTADGATPAPPRRARTGPRMAAGRALLGLALLGSALWHAPAGLAQEPREKGSLTVVTVNEQESSLNLVGSIANQLPEELRRLPLESYYDRIIDDIIDTKLAADAAREAGLDDDPLLAEIADYTRDRALAGAWITGEIRGRITNAMIEERYQRVVADAESRVEVHARHILLGSAEEAGAAIQRLRDGADFAELARELSTGPSGPNGGDLGYFGRGAMVPEFETASFGLEAGSFSETPVQTQFGWHIIKVEDRRTAPPPALEDVREQLIEALAPQVVAEIIAELRSAASISKLSFGEVREAEEKRRAADSR